MAELTAGQKEINRKLAEAGLPPRFPESSGDQTTPKTIAELKGVGAQLLRDGAKGVKEAADLKKVAVATLGGQLSPAILDSGKPPTPDKTFFDNLDPTFSAVLGGRSAPPKYGGTELAEAADKLPKQSEYIPLFDDKPKGFGTSMGSRSTSSLSGSVGKLGERRTLGTPASAMRREARRLRNLGYKDASEKMALEDSMQRLNEPAITTQEQRGRMSAQAKQGDMAAEEAKALQQEQTDYMRKLIKARQEQLNEGILPPYSPYPMGQTTAGATSNFFS